MRKEKCGPYNRGLGITPASIMVIRGREKVKLRRKTGKLKGKHDIMGYNSHYLMMVMIASNDRPPNIIRGR